MTSTSAPERPLRADARRNRDRVLAVAAEMFAEQGLDVGVAEIARRAEVGSATLFRHFPTKEALIAAVFEQRLEEFETILDGVEEIEDPQEAFRTMMVRVVRAQVRDRALVQSLINVVSTFAQPRIEEHIRRVTAEVGAVLQRAQEAGVVRDDVIPEDLMALCCGVASANCAELERPDLVERYLGVILDGLRAEQPTPLHPAPATVEDIAAAQQRCGCASS